MNRPAWLLSLPRRWVLAGVAILTGLVLTVYGATFATATDDLRFGALSLAAMQIGLLTGLLAALSLRRPVPRWRQTPRPTAVDLAVIVLVAGIAAAIGAGVGQLVGLWLETAGPPRITGAAALQAGSERVVHSVVCGGFCLVATSVSFAICRGLVEAYVVWDRQRRRSLQGALTHALLVASVIIACGLAGVLSVGAVSTMIHDRSSEVLAATNGWSRVLAFFVFQVVPVAMALFVLAFVVAVVVGPLVGMIAWPVIGRATRRIAALTAATDAIQAGRLDARVAVSGEDEIARLQTDFNAMAADLERSLRELRAEHDAVEALLESRRQLFAAISHDLRTPLATIRGYLDSLLADPIVANSATGSSLGDDLAIISQETDRLDHMINDLFALARVDLDQLPLTIAPVALSPLLGRIVETNQPLTWSRGRVELVSDLTTGLPPALADPERVEQIVRNLLTNAVRHTPPGGLVMIATSAEGDELRIDVRDTGSGIPPADLPLIWERFYRARNTTRQSGAGLGLALVKALATAMGGRVGAESALGEGSSFSIWLPRADRVMLAASRTWPVTGVPATGTPVSSPAALAVAPVHPATTDRP